MISRKIIAAFANGASLPVFSDAIQAAPLITNGGFEDTTSLVHQRGDTRTLANGSTTMWI